MLQILLGMPALVLFHRGIQHLEDLLAGSDALLQPGVDLYQIARRSQQHQHGEHERHEPADRDGAEHPFQRHQVDDAGPGQPDQQHDDRRHQGRHLLRADLSLPEMLGRLIEACFFHRLGLEHLYDPITLNHLLGILHGRGERLHHAVAKLADSPVAAGNQPSEYRHGGQERNGQDPAHVQHPADQADHHQAVPDQDGEAFRCRRGHALDVAGDARQEIAGSRVVVGFCRKLEQARKHFPPQVPDQARSDLCHAGRAEIRTNCPQHENPDQRQRTQRMTSGCCSTIAPSRIGFISADNAGPVAASIAMPSTAKVRMPA